MEERYIQGLVWKPAERDHLEDPGVDLDLQEVGWGEFLD
jgi:hypothetical protein